MTSTKKETYCDTIHTKPILWFYCLSSNTINAVFPRFSLNNVRKKICDVRKHTPIANICRCKLKHVTQKCNLSLNWENLLFQTTLTTVSSKIELSFMFFNILRGPFTWAYPVTLYACPVTNPFDNLLLCPCVILVCNKIHVIHK